MPPAPRIQFPEGRIPIDLTLISDGEEDSGESSCEHGNQHGAISSVDSAKAFAACPAAQARLASGESSSVHGAISSLRLHRRL